MKILKIPLIYFLFFLNASCSKGPDTGNNTPPPQVPNNATLNDVVYNLTDVGKLEALNASDGSTRWSCILDSNALTNSVSIFSSPAYVDSTLYIGSSDYYVYAINAKTGKVKWRFFTGRTSIDPYNEYLSSPAVSNKVLYIGGDKLYAINTDAGDLRWSKNLDNREVHSSPLVVNNVVYVNSLFDFYAFDAGTGSQLKQVNSLRYKFRNVSPCYFNGVVYNISEVQEIPIYQGVFLYTVSPEMLEGAGRGFGFQFNGPATNNWYSSPTVNDSSLYVCSDSLLYALEIEPAPTTPLKWKFTGDGVFDYYSPIADTARVYISNSKGLLYAIHAKTGSPDWIFDVKQKGSNRILNSPVLANGIIYISSDRAIYAINALDGKEIWRKNTVLKYGMMSSACVVSKTGEAFYSSISPMQN
jgi:outer membrane protein assembly factor BamB